MAIITADANITGYFRRHAGRLAAAAEMIASSRYPDGAEWAREYVLHYYSDTEALAALAQIARQQEGPAR